MKIQEINTDRGIRYLLLDDEYKVVDEVKRFLKYLDNCGKSPNTLKNYAYHLKTYYEYLNYKKINIKDLCKNEKMGPIDILSNFLLYLQYPDKEKGIIHVDGEIASRSNKTVNIIMDTVLSFYEYLSKNNELEELDLYKNQRTNGQFKSFLSELVKNKTNINKSLFKQKTIIKNIEYITRTQYIDLFNNCLLKRDKILIGLLYEGGLRINEALGMHISDFDELEDGVIKIIPRENNENNARVKNFAGGIIKIPDYLIDLILDYIGETLIDSDNDFFFINIQGKNKGQPMQYITSKKLFERLSIKVGLHVHPHMLRHGFATEKIELGWDMSDIKSYLRHKQIQSTEVYTHYSDELKKEKMRLFLENQKNEIKRGLIIE